MLTILPFVFMVPGFFTVFAARFLVRKFGLDQKVHCEFENEMSNEELEKYKTNKAVVNLKMLGMLIALPGIVLLVFVFN